MVTNKQTDREGKKGTQWSLHSTGVLMDQLRGKGVTEQTYPVLGEERLSDTWYTPLVLPDKLEFLWKIQK